MVRAMMVLAALLLGASLLPGQVPVSRVALPNGSMRLAGGRDVDGDGRGDLLIVSTAVNPVSPATVAVYSGMTGALVWSLAPLSPTSTGAYFPTLLPDRDGDGRAEPAVIWGPSGVLAIYSGAMGALQTTLSLPGGSPVSFIDVVRDVTHDGVDDLVVIHGAGAGVLEFRDSQTLAIVATPAGPAGFSGEIGDFDGDGTSDYAVGNRICSGTSLSPVLFDSPAWYTSELAAVGDVNADGFADAAVITHSWEEAPFGVVHGGLGGAHPVTWLSGRFYNIVALGDVDGDGHGDYGRHESAGAGGTLPNRYEIRSGATHGSLFTLTGDFQCDQFGSCAVAMGDLDSDGSTDLAVGAQGECGGYGQPCYVRVFRSNPVVLARAVALGPGFGGLPAPAILSPPGCSWCGRIGWQTARIGMTLGGWELPVGAPQGAHGYVFAGFPAAAPILVAPSSAVYFDPAQPYMVFDGFANGSGGMVGFTYSIPDDPILIGVQLVLQAFFPDPTHPTGWNGSYGLGLTLGYGATGID